MVKKYFESKSKILKNYHNFSLFTIEKIFRTFYNYLDFTISRTESGMGSGKDPIS